MARPSVRPAGLQGSRRDRSSAAAVALVLAMAMTGAWWQMRQQHRAGLRIESELASAQAAGHLRAWMDARLALVAHLAERADRFADDPAAFEADARQLLDRMPGLQALNWMDPEWRIRVTVPPEGNEAALGRDLHEHGAPDVAEAVARADRSGRPTRTHALVELLQGGSGFGTYWPVTGPRGRRVGFVNAVFRTDQLIAISGVAHHLEDRFRLALLEDEGVAFGADMDGEAWPLAERRRIPVLDREWTLVVAPSPSRLALLETGAGWAAVQLVGGWGACIGIGWLLYGLLSRRTALASLERALEQANDAVVLLDERGIMRWANPAMARMMGRPQAELVGAPIRSLANGENDADLLRSMRESLARGETWHGRYHTVWPDGSRHAREASVAPVRDPADRISGYVGVLRDRTREDDLETALRHSQKMEAVGRLAGGAAHDFNNLLTVIRGCGEQLAEELRDRPDSRRAATAILAATERAGGLVRQLLAFSRRQPRCVRRILLNAIVEDMVEMLGRLSGGGVSLQLDLDPGVGPVEVDPSQVEQALLNLCANARDAMPSGGRITLATRPVRLDGPGIATLPELPTGRYAELSVEDTGEGMEPELQSRIFEPFFTTKEIGSGTGLGLALVYGIAEQSGGAVRVESEPGRGTRLSMLFPIADGPLEPAEKPPPAAAPTRGGHETVLVVEDEAAIRALIERALVRAGYTVLLACDGCEALEVADRHEGAIDLLLSDVVMPRLGGPELGRRLRRARPGLRVLYMSGYAADPLAGPGAELLEKPFAPRELLVRVRAELERPAPEPTGDA